MTEHEQVPPEPSSTQGDPLLPPPRPMTHHGRFVGPADDPDRYELIDEGVVGGEGTTWRARYRGSLREPLPVALKRLNPPRGAGPDWPGESDRRRWSDQAALLRHLRLPQVVQLHQVFVGAAPHEAGTVLPGLGSEVYLEMEWVDGPTLSQLLRDRPPTPDTVERRLRCVVDVATALTGLHSHTRSGGNPSLHRDVTPGNCIVNAGRGVVLIDLSTMRLLDDGADPAGMHTPGYTAPEVLRAPREPREVTCDLYALGALAFFCLTGEDPPRAEVPGMLDVVRDRVLDVGRRIGLADADPLAAHLIAMLDPRPTRRPTDMIAWAHRLVELGRVGVPPVAAVAPPPVRRRFRPRLLGATVLVTAVAASVTWAVGGPWVPGSGADELTAQRSGGTASPSSGTTTTHQAVAATPSATSSTTPGATMTPTAAPTPSPGLTSRHPSDGGGDGDGDGSGTTPRPTSSSSPPVRPRTTPKAPVPPPVTPAATAAAVITFPADGSTVKSCSYFSGTSSVPAGMTLITVVRNLSNPAAGDYADNVQDWQTASTQSTWRGAMYFNPESTGQTFRVQVRMVTTDLMSEVIDTDRWGPLATAGTVLDSVQVTRVDGEIGDSCRLD